MNRRRKKQNGLTTCDKFSAPELTILEAYVRSLPVEKGFALRQGMYGLTPGHAARQ